MKIIKLLKKPKYIIALIVILLLILIPIFTKRDIGYVPIDQSLITPTTEFSDHYSHVSDDWDKNYVKNVNDTVIAPDMIGNLIDGNAHDVAHDVLYLGIGDSATININVDEAGIYQLSLNQKDISTSILPNRIGVMINGVYQFDEARTIELNTIWQFTRPDFIRDRYGNEILPDSEKYGQFFESDLFDPTALNSRPLQFKFEAGMNTIELVHIDGEILIESLIFKSVEMLPTYEDYLNNHSDSSLIEDELITIGAENFISKTNPSTRLRSINDPAATAYHSQYSLLNAVEGYSFRSGNDTITYRIDVNKTGYYHISIKYKQDFLQQMPVFREVKINNQVPFDELSVVPFQYTNTYENYVLGNEEGAYKIYLEKGSNTVSLRVVLDPYRNAYEHVVTIMEEITDLSLEIKRLTGNTTDNYRNWKLETYIPDIEERLNSWINTLEMLRSGLSTYSVYENPGEITNISLAINRLKDLAEDVNDIPNNMVMLADGDSSTAQLLGTVAQVLLENGLNIEQINITGDLDNVPNAQANFFVRFYESIKRFFLSFKTSDYAVEEVDDDVIEIWVNYPRQYVEIMQQIIDSEFTEETGIKVKLSLMPDENKLILANAANRPPDIALGVNHWIPYEFAIRNASLDLRQFEGYEELVSNFSPGVMIPYAFEDGMYGIPQTQNFWVTFYREDLFRSMNLTPEDVPDTWEEVIEILPVLQRFGMNYFEPLAQFGGFKPFVATIPFIYQFGGELYAEDGMTTLINSEENLAGMRMMTDLFTVYDMPKQVPNFYNQFRTGTLPIGIGDLATYLQLTIAAPEIAGKWSIAPHPGVYNEETGEVERWAASGAQSLMILSDTKMPQESWEFVEWWMSTETQVNFAERLQTTYGTEFFWNTANLEAFAQLSLPPEHIAVILEQWEYALEASRIPGAYMVEREISNAWNTIIFNDANPRIALDEAVKTANREIIYRMEEFGYVENGEVVKPYRVPTIYNIDYWLKERNNDE